MVKSQSINSCFPANRGVLSFNKCLKSLSSLARNFGYGHVLRAMPYLCKEDHLNDVDVAEHVVLTVMDPYHKTDQKITADHFFTNKKAPHTRHYNNRSSAQH